MKDGRRGGLSIFTVFHNACADRPQYTDYPGSDVELTTPIDGTVSFDGLKRAENPPGTFYEIKTGLFYSTMKRVRQTRPSVQKLLDVLLAKALVGYARERLTAAACTFEFRYGARDPLLLLDMQQILPTEAPRMFLNGC